MGQPLAGKLGVPMLVLRRPVPDKENSHGHQGSSANHAPRRARIIKEIRVVAPVPPNRDLSYRDSIIVGWLLWGEPSSLVKL
jgi:hypothetical protein